MTSREFESRVSRVLNVGTKDLVFPSLNSSLRDSFDGRYGSNISPPQESVSDEQVLKYLAELRCTVIRFPMFEEHVTVSEAIRKLSKSSRRKSLSRDSPPPKRTKNSHTESPRSMILSPSSTPIQERQQSTNQNLSAQSTPNHSINPGSTKSSRECILCATNFERDAIEIKRCADKLRAEKEKAETYVRSSIQFLLSLYWKELAMEAYRRERNDTERRKMKDQVIGAYKKIAVYIHQCKVVSKSADTTAFLNVCESVSYYRSFRINQDTTTHSLDRWLGEIRQGNKTVSREHENFILRPLNNMIKALSAWKRAVELYPSRMPQGNFTTILAPDLEEFWARK